MSQNDTPTKAPTRPLDGILVADFTHVLSGPYCTMLMADLGAEVVKIERPGRGDENRRMRNYPGRSEADEDYFYPMNRNKKSVEVDLKDSEARRKLDNLLLRADVVVENFTPGAMKKLGLDYENLRKLNPEVIYCSISGFGQTGPYSNRKAYDSIVQAISGVMSITGAPDGPPQRSGLMFADLSGAMYAFSSIMTSLFARERTGKGTYIDLSMSDALLSLYSTNAAEFMAVGKPPLRAGSENPGRSPTGSYLCSDDKYIQIMGGSDTLWRPFCAALGLDDLYDDPLFVSNETRIANRDRLLDLLTPVFATKSSQEWVNTLNTLGVPAAPINSLKEIFEDPHFLERGMLQVLEHPKSGPIKTISNPFRFSTWDTSRNIPPPVLGQHNSEY